MKYTEVGHGSDRLEMLGYDILALISDGQTESVNDIIAHFENKNVVNYLMSKYKGKLSLITENCPYNIDDWEELFEQDSYITFGHDVSRKFGLCNEEKDGLLLMVSLILEKVAQRKYQ